MEIQITKVYKSLYTDIDIEEPRKALLYSPRCSGKSTTLAHLIYIYYLKFPEYDIGVGVDTLTNAGETVLSEFVSFLQQKGLNNNNEWVILSRMAYMRGHNNQIRVYSVQTTKHSNINITKGKKLIRPLSLFIMDEVQKLHNEDILLNCLSTFLRQMKKGHSKLVLAGNPDRGALWFTKYCKQKEQDKEWVVLRPTYKDIIKWLPCALLSEISSLAKYDAISYRQIYLGDLTALGWASVFHSFIEDKHYIKRGVLLQTDAQIYKNEAGPYLYIIGVDDAESNDALACTLVTMHQNGMLRAQESLYLSCHELTVKPALTERCALIISYLDYINEHFNVQHNIPIIFSFDSASGLYSQMLTILRTDRNYMRWRNVQLLKYKTKQEKSAQLDLINAAFANNTLIIVNVDEYSPQYSNAHLVAQIKALQYMENGRIDPTIPNDCVDALQYAVMMVLRNPYNLTLPQRRAEYFTYNKFEKYIQQIKE